MKRLISWLTTFCILALMFATSCEYAWIDYEDVPIPDTVSLANDVVPIFERGCNATVCHGGGANPDLRPDRAYNSLINGGYVNTGDPVLSSIHTSIINGGSMEQYAEPGDDQIILKWIEQGALNN